MAAFADTEAARLSVNCIEAHSMRFTVVATGQFSLNRAFGFRLTASSLIQLSVVNSPIRPAGLAPAWHPASPAHSAFQNLPFKPRMNTDFQICAFCFQENHGGHKPPLQPGASFAEVSIDETVRHLPPNHHRATLLAPRPFAWLFPACRAGSRICGGCGERGRGLISKPRTAPLYNSCASDSFLFDPQANWIYT